MHRRAHDQGVLGEVDRRQRGRGQHRVVGDADDSVDRQRLDARSRSPRRWGTAPGTARRRWRTAGSAAARARTPASRRTAASPPVDALSNRPPRFHPARMPTRTPITVATSVEVPSSTSVGQVRPPIRSQTGWPFHARDAVQGERVAQVRPELLEQRSVQLASDPRQVLGTDVLDRPVARSRVAGQQPEQEEVEQQDEHQRAEAGQQRGSPTNRPRPPLAPPPTGDPAPGGRRPSPPVTPRPRPGAGADAPTSHTRAPAITTAPVTAPEQHAVAGLVVAAGSHCRHRRAGC